MSKSPETNALLEKHLAHELNALRGEGLKKTITVEISALYEWFDEVSLNDFINAAQVWDFFIRNIVELPIRDEVPAYLTECAKKVHACMQNDNTKLGGILPKEKYDSLVGRLVELKKLRKEIIHHVVNNSVFIMLINDTLYRGIKSFMVSENALMKNVPGASTLMSLGAGLLKKSTFGLADNIAAGIDEKMKKFVENNVKETLLNSETFLNDSLDRKRLQELGDEIWETASKYNAHSITEFLTSADIDALAPIITDFWLNLRKSSIFLKISRTIVEFFFDRYGKIKISKMLDEFGFTKEKVLHEINATAVPVLEKDIVFAYLEKRLRARLELFYYS